MKTWQLNEALLESFHVCKDMIDDEEEAAQFIITKIVMAFDDLSKDGKLDYEDFMKFVQESLEQAKKSRSAA